MDLTQTQPAHTPAELTERKLQREPEERRRAISEAVKTLPALGAFTTERYGVYRLTVIWLDSFRSTETQAAYYQDLVRWLTWCHERDLNPFRVRPSDVDQYRSDNLNAVSRSTAARRMSAVSSWYRYLVRNEAAPSNPFKETERPKAASDESPTRGLSRAEAAAFHSALQDVPPTRRARTMAVLSLLLLDGLRSTELRSIRISDMGYNRGHRTITLRRKGGSRHQVSVTPTTGHLIDVYLQQRTEPASDDDYLFITEPHPGQDRNTGGRPLDRWELRRTIRQVARRAGISQPDTLSPHSLRHTFATLSLDSGVDLRDVQDAMGHRDPRTTRRYDRARAALDRHPASRLEQYIAAAEREDR